MTRSKEFPFSHEKNEVKNNDKKYLLDKIKNQYSNERKNPPPMKFKTTDYKKLYRQTRKELERYKKKVRSFQQHQIDKKNDEQEQRDEIKSLKSKIHEIQLENKKMKEHQETTGLELKKSTSKVYLLAEDIKAKKHELKMISSTVQKMKKKVDKRDRLINMQKQKISWMKNESVESYISEIEQLRDLKLQLESRINRVQKEKQKMQLVISSFENFDIKALLQFLYDNLTLSNHHTYKLLPALNRKYFMTKSNFNRMHQNNEVNYAEPIYGYVKKSFVFVDLQDKEYQIKHYPKIKLKNGDPVAAMINQDSTVDVIWKYDTYEYMKMDMELNVKKNKNKIQQNKKDYEYLGDYNVLVVTTNAGKKYKNRLLLHGLDADWIDPYEKSPVHIQSKMQKSDLVLICLDSVPHLVLELIEENSPVNKYQLLMNHNEETVYNRVRLVLNKGGSKRE